ncbi:MAG: GNAT family N-acetyltransferase [Deltaproteobacteria bacterium]|nr:GNAT family N-acetyltransferase [Deltaproteobacteria bacterium]MBW2070814.1 GNAT family N-acetyltransferase [Deltaproteobacteria bacterium]
MNVSTYRKFITLADGSRVLFRPLVHADQEKLVALFQQASAEDVLFLKEDVRNPELVGSWVRELNYDKVIPIVAVRNEEIIGDASLHRRTGTKRHTAEVRIFLAPAFRGIGLGSVMVSELVALAKNLGLRLLEGQIVVDQVNVIKAFRKLGFKRVADIDDYFMTQDGRTHDVALMILELKEEREYRF